MDILQGFMASPFRKAWAVLKEGEPLPKNPREAAQLGIESEEEEARDFKEEFPEVYASRTPQNWNPHSIADVRRLHTAPQTGDWPEWHVNYNKENEKLPPIPKTTPLERFIQQRQKDPAQQPTGE